MIHVVICGDEMVGKTSLLTRFENNGFPQTYHPTIAIDFKQIHTRNAHFRICDTSGKTKYEQVVSNQFKEALVILFVFDLSNPDSLESVTKRWLRLAQWEERQRGNVFGYLIGNKIDLNKEEIDCDPICQAHRLTYIKTSALTGEGVYDMFIRIGDTVNTRHNKLLSEGVIGLLSDNNMKILEFDDILDDGVETRKGCCCCKKKAFIKV